MIRSTITQSRRTAFRQSSSSSSPPSTASLHAPHAPHAPHGLRLFVVAIPVTSHRSYIYCNHELAVLSLARLNKVSWIQRMDTKVVALASKGWHKLSQSPSYINVQITRVVRKLLGTIPYQEHCVALFPSQSAMVRELACESQDRFTKIPVYYPSLQPQHVIHAELARLARRLHHHRQYAWLCAGGIPLTLPVAVVPLVPNVPGIYLAFRLYSHIKALLGCRHLQHLIGGGDAPAHFQLVASDEMQAAYAINCEAVNCESGHPSAHPSGHPSAHPESANHEIAHESAHPSGHPENHEITHQSPHPESVVLTEDIAARICREFDLPHLKLDLLKAMRQEHARLATARALTQGT